MKFASFCANRDFCSVQVIKRDLGSWFCLQMGTWLAVWGLIRYLINSIINLINFTVVLEMFYLITVESSIIMVRSISVVSVSVHIKAM